MTPPRAWEWQTTIAPLHRGYDGGGGWLTTKLAEQVALLEHVPDPPR
ncbi:MAG: hypothetical protein K0U76_15185 [Actinomycetia bacterium]|nr:hypothetical protein [Actinomycetes bacterium]MCH9702695.1 hypothetical protein [Actinomycetes bacterium]MCH9760714.1 hypothetical protein [Actinomycetes bacterium]